MRHSKSSSKSQVGNNTSLPQETRNVSYKQPNLTPKAIRERTTKNPKVSRRKEKQGWRNQATGFQTILQSYSNQDSMVLAQKQKYRSMEQDRKPRGKPTQIGRAHV